MRTRYISQALNKIVRLSRIAWLRLSWVPFLQDLEVIYCLEMIGEDLRVGNRVFGRGQRVNSALDSSWVPLLTVGSRRWVDSRIFLGRLNVGSTLFWVGSTQVQKFFLSLPFLKVNTLSFLLPLYILFSSRFLYILFPSLLLYILFPSLLPLFVIIKNIYMGKDAINNKLQTSLIKIGTFSYIHVKNKDRYNVP